MPALAAPSTQRIDIEDAVAPAPQPARAAAPPPPSDMQRRNEHSRRHYFCATSRPVMYCFGCSQTGLQSAAIWREPCPGKSTRGKG